MQAQHKKQTLSPQAPVLVVGAGITGATLARRLAEEKGRQVVVIDRRSHLAGNCFDADHDGILVHEYGPHIFHTNDQRVWEFLSRFTAWEPFFLRVQAVIEGKNVNIPFNFDSIEKCFTPDLAQKMQEALLIHYDWGKQVSILELQESGNETIRMLADYVYNHVFANYTAKQWGCRLDELDESVAARVPVVMSRDDRYFHDRYQAIPAEGYTRMIERMLDHEKISVRLETDYRQAEGQEWAHVYYTGAIDEFFAYRLGELPYRSLRFEQRTYQCEHYQDNVIVNYPNNYDFTRICEHKYFLPARAASAHTVVSLEYPQEFEVGKNERFYPINNKQTAELYRKYAERAADTPGVTFMGRLGDYKYYNMDAAVARAMEVKLEA